MTITIDILEELLNHSESDYLDHKKHYWTNTTDLIHDILCMANSLAKEKQRFMVFGVEDATKDICGVENDSNRKTKQNITDTLRNAGINNVPHLELKTISYKQHQIDVLIIYPSPAILPYLLSKDHRNGKKMLRNGVIYTRNNDTNTPMDSSATPEQMAQLWLKRFGLDKPPLKRLRGYIEEIPQWKRLDSKGQCTIHHVQFTDFTINIDYNDPVTKDFKEPWSERFPDKQAISYNLEFKHKATVLKRELFVSCDGNRYFVPMPTRNSEGEFFYDTTKMAFATWKLLVNIEAREHAHHLKDIKNFLSISKIRLVPS